MEKAEQRQLEERVLVLAPTHKDAAMSQGVLKGAGLACTLCSDLYHLCRELRAGAAAVLLTEEALANKEAGMLMEMLAHQPPWSDLPVLVMTRGGGQSPLAGQIVQRIDNVVLLERPVQVVSLMSAARSAVRARRRQYQLRQYWVEREQSEESLRQSEATSRALLSAVPDLMFRVRSDGTYVEYGGRTERLYVAPEQFIGRTVSEVLPREVAAALMGCTRAALASGEVQCCEYTLEVRGKQGYFEARVVACGADEVLHFVRDIADRKRAEEALRQSEEQARRIIDNQIGFMGMMTPQGTVVEINAPALRVGALERQDVVGKKLWDAYWFNYDPQVQTQLRDAVARAAGGEVVSYDVLVRTAHEGRMVIALMLTPVHNAAGQITHLIPSAIDITHRKQAEEALRQSERQFRIMGETVPYGVWLCDPDGAVRYCSQSFLDLINMTQEEQQRFGWTSRLVPEDVEPMMAKWLHCCATGTPWEHEHRIIDRHGKIHTILSKGLPVRDAEGKITCWTGVNLDITDRKAGEEALATAKNAAEQAKAAAEEANAAKDRFLAVLSHELRNPLAPVLPALAALQKVVPEEGREYLEIAIRNVELEARLIDDLLDVTRIARGKIELERRPIQLCEVVQRAAEVCKADIEARRLHFGIKVENGPHPVHVDPARMQQVFWNLIKNAVKFTPHGGCVGVRCWRENGQALVQVTDSGEGIAPEAMPSLFNAFEQESRATTRQFGGLGLGLAISKALVDMHGGTIQVYSAGKGKGTTFTVALPLAVLGPLEKPVAPAGVAAPPAAAANLRILLVEDHGDTARMMGKLLRAEGHTVKHAGDVATALELAGGEVFDLLISDLGLPDGSGHDLMRQLRARGQRMRGIALSGYGMAADVQKSHEAGYAAHLTKPVNFDAVLATVNRIASAEPSPLAPAAYSVGPNAE